MRLPFISAVFLAICLLLSCAKKCDCYLYDKNNKLENETPEERTMPRSLKLECTFFDTYVDTVGGYKCK